MKFNKNSKAAVPNIHYMSKAIPPAKRNKNMLPKV